MKKDSKRFFRNVFETLSRPEMTVLPGQLAFFFILSLVPTISLIVSFASIFKVTLTDINEYFNLGITSNVFTYLEPAFNYSGFSLSMILVIIISIYLSSNGTNSIIVSANNIYGIKQKPFLYRRIKAIVMVFITILLFLFMLLVPIFGNFILSLLTKAAGNNVVNDILNIVKYPFSWLGIYIFIKILYTIAPDKEISSSYVTKGAMFTSIGWVIATMIYLYYAGNFAHYDRYYSGLSNVAVLMIWVYILAYIFVIGMGINHKEEPYEIEKTQKIEYEKIAKKSQHKY